MIGRILTGVVLLVVAGRCAAADAKLAVTVQDAPPPVELAAPVRALLESKALAVTDDKGGLLCTVWPRKELASKAPADPAPATGANAHSRAGSRVVRARGEALLRHER